MELIQKLTERRGRLRTFVTKRVGKLPETLLITDTEVLEELLYSFEIKESDFYALDSKMQDLIGEAEKFRAELTACEEYKEKIVSFKFKLKQRIKKINEEAELAEMRTRLLDSSTLSNAESVVAPTASALKLPKLELGKFNGDSSKFTEFFNCFNNAIGNNEGLTKVEKFQYLKSLLIGPAYYMVEGFEINEKNYDSCLELLKGRFGKTDVIINTYMTKLLNLEPVKYSYHVKGLHRLYDEIEITIRNLRALKVTEGSYGNLLNPIILKLIPPDLVLDFHRKRDRDKTCEVQELISFIRNELESREIAESSHALKPETKRVNAPFQGVRPKSYPSAGAFNTNVRSKCLFCLGFHDSNSCRKTTRKEKFEKLRAEGRCFVCFDKNHISNSCAKGLCCRICNSISHTEVLCRKNSDNRSWGTQNPGKPLTESKLSKGTDQISSDVSDPKVEVLAVAHNSVPGTKSSYLLTCKVMVCSDESNKGQEIRLILDSGSHRSFASKRLVKELNLKPSRYETLAIYTFGEKRYPVVSLILKNKLEPNQQIKVECLVTILCVKKCCLI